MQSGATSCGQSSSESENPPHASVSEIDAFAVHHRAGAADHADIVLPAVLDGILRDTRSLPQGLVHPNAADPGIATVTNDLLRGLRSRDDHHSVDPARD